jgi:phosphate:Na+ symporter
VDIKDMMFLFIGGLGMFLFGIKYMSDGLQNAAGDNLRTILERMTSHPIKGVFAGMLVTAMIQSSTGTTVLTVGLVNAGLLPLRQAIGIIMGANVGTTLTSFIIGFNITQYSLPIVAIGAIMLFFIKKKSINNIGQIIFGFGMLFLGLKNMSTGMSPLRDSEFFLDFMQSFVDKPVIGVIVGIIFTVIVQSSAATIGIMQMLAESGAITLHQSLPILFGDNIGTTITAALAAIGASVAAKRAAMSHILFNVIGTVIFMILLQIGIYPALIELIAGDMNIKMQIAWSHGIFNAGNVLIQLPFIGVFVYVVTKLVPGEIREFDHGIKYIDKRLLNNPSLALRQVVHELARMGGFAKDSLADAIDYFFTGDEEKVLHASMEEEIVNELEKKITQYLIKISQRSLSKKQSNQASIYLQIANDVERIGDHSDNIIELTQYAHMHQLPFSEEAKQEIRTMFDLTLESCVLAFTALENLDPEMAKQVIENEDIIDKMEADFRKSHLKRLNTGECGGSSGVIFLDIIGNLERISDHCFNIAQAIKEDVYY